MSCHVINDRRLTEGFVQENFPYFECEYLEASGCMWDVHGNIPHNNSGLLIANVSSYNLIQLWHVPDYDAAAAAEYVAIIIHTGI